MPAFAPIVKSTTAQSKAGQPTAPNPKVLILGSMPSRISLANQEYYGNQQNAFWWLMAQLLGFPKNLDYVHRCDRLIGAGLAVWDVLADCERAGSLDSNIVRSSEKLNDFSTFLAEYPEIELLAFNGGAAKAIFMRHCGDILIDSPNLSWVLLPSTSPAHASRTRDEKLSIWRTALQARIV